MANTSLVDRAHELSRQLANVIKLTPGEDPLRRANGAPDAANFLFEVLVLIELLLVLTKLGNVICVKRDGYILLARAPASKRTKSYFVWSVDGAKYDLLPGIDIFDRAGGTQAPDFALHDHVIDTELPNYVHVRAIWDAKLRGETGAASEEPIAKGEFAMFLLMMDLLAVPRPGDARDILVAWQNAFEVSALISNGRIPARSKDFMIEKGVSVTEHFANHASRCMPSRAEHSAKSRGPGAPSPDKPVTQQAPVTQ